MCYKYCMTKNNIISLLLPSLIDSSNFIKFLSFKKKIADVNLALSIKAKIRYAFTAPTAKLNHVHCEAQPFHVIGSRNLAYRLRIM